MAGPNSFVQVNATTVPAGKKLATYEFLEGSDVVESEAVTLTDANGDEVIGAKPMAESLPVTFATDQTPLAVTSAPSTLEPGGETAVSNVAVLVLAANPLRTSAIVQNTGTANIRVGAPGVTTTSGLRLIPNAIAEYGAPGVYQGELWAIREGGADSVAFAQEEQT